MCCELEGFRGSIAGFAAGFDASRLSPAEAGVVVRVCARIEASVASVKALAVARYAQGQSWKTEGFRSASDQLAVQTGMTASHARRVLDTGRRMTELPEVAAVALAGDLSAEQAAAVSEGAAADPGQTKELIDRARHSSMSELNEEVARVKAASCDLDARRRAIHAKRHFRRWSDTDGGFHARFYGLPEDGVMLWQALDAIRRRLIVKRREEGHPNEALEALEALDYDSVVALAGAAVGQARHLDPAEMADLGLFPDLARPSPDSPPGRDPAVTAGTNGDEAGDLLSLLDQPDQAAPGAGSVGRSPDTSSGPPGLGPAAKKRKKLGGSAYQVIIRVDYDTLLRGLPLGDEVCEMDGHGLIPVSLIEQIAQTNPFISTVLTRNSQVLGVYHFSRRPTTAQTTALNWLYPTCAARGCNARLRLQTDHRDDWARTHYTLLDCLDRLCPHHHNLKTRDSWALVEGTGKRDFVPPTDPRHPRHPRHKSPPAATGAKPP